MQKEQVLQMKDEERRNAEEILIQMIEDHKLGWLAQDALVILRSEKALPVLYGKMADDTMSDLARMKLATDIYRINCDDAMCERAINLSRYLRSKNDILNSLELLYRLNSIESRNVIAEFVDSPEYPIAHKAQRLLRSMGGR